VNSIEALCRGFGLYRYGYLEIFRGLVDGVCCGFLAMLFTICIPSVHIWMGMFALFLGYCTFSSLGCSRVKFACEIHTSIYRRMKKEKNANAR
jgi:hypothetical protein